MSDPTKFFQDFVTAEKDRKFASGQVFARKMLRRFFSDMLDINIEDIWEDDHIKDKMAEVRARTAHPLLSVLHFLPSCRVNIDDAYRDFTKSQVWRDMMKALQSSPRAVLVFPLARAGMHAFHNIPMDQMPGSVARKPRIIWPGNAGNSLTLVKLDVFLTEYNN